MTRAALALAVLLAWAVARRVPSPRQRAIAAALTGLLALDVVRPWLAPGSDADVATFAAWWALTAGAVWSVLGKDETPEAEASGGCENHGAEYVRAKHPPPRAQERGTSGPFRSGPASAILLLAAVIASPIAYRHGLDVGRASFALALAAQLLAVLCFASRGKMPDGPQAVALILALSSLADAFGPWLFGQPDRDWPLARWISVVTWTVVSGVQIWMLLRRRTA